ncbi:MAG: biotin--[acetyl-CoA-carboxylase] ligase [Ignavibacteria bacterium]|nr:biotin--[acetyl-CoA-carboxylase] ligase [Ignavibacteria bacterium]MBT8382631.1 biotin--[acetyl-CoA-carboxylase] ligase [Ignavibacteria bacterium]MBT8392105.1 biotin--[acetyl-CoA-carboxylase] ligase [Ignavibacteria bacterium]NNJ52445.1 biotin--[acetyl-CoA-carboxylase] ligase [Ignavibacteriaceae bacterium]NNL21813.1 biotin--[acetyl-CoA-carboxylase] ligase [Ignavibacteriaceae bacterium]
MFDIEKFDLKLETDFIGRNFVYADELGSTNEELLGGKNPNNKSGMVLLAEKQTRGKGRKNRIWHSSKGQNLTFSILLSDEKSLGVNINHLNLFTSVVVSSAIENLYQLRSELKWPNDVLTKGKKIAGILTETSIKGNKFENAVIGIGINVNQTLFQGEFNYPPTSLKFELKHDIERESLLAEILNLFEDEFNNLLKSPKNILDEWRSKCKMIGDKISITEDEKIKTGVFHDIDENGYLILNRKGEFEKIHFGDVSLSE